MRKSLKALNILFREDTNLSLFQRATMKDNINKLVEHISYFELTEELLHRFKNVAPEMYSEIDTIKDCKGQSITVYVKFVPEKEMQRGAAGTTNLGHADNNKHVYHSEYGPHTVSIKIASVIKSLILLAHEFGHAKYQIKNLATYAEYYSTHYQNTTFTSKYIGHNSNDPSGKISMEYENMFRFQYLAFLKTNSDEAGNPHALLQRIRRNLLL